jgi:hypothetical protein
VQRKKDGIDGKHDAQNDYEHEPDLAKNVLDGGMAGNVRASRIEAIRIGELVRPHASRNPRTHGKALELVSINPCAEAGV